MNPLLNRWFIYQTLCNFVSGAPDLEAGALTRGPAGVGREVQPEVSLGRRGEGDGNGVAAAGGERVGRGHLGRREVRAVGAAEHRQRLVARSPRRGQLQDDAARILRRAEVDLDPLREGVV